MPLPHSMTWNGTSMALAVHYVDFATLVPPAAAKGQGLLVRKQNTYEVREDRANFSSAATLLLIAYTSQLHGQTECTTSVWQLILCHAAGQQRHFAGF